MEYVREKKSFERNRDFSIRRNDSGEWEIEAPWLERILMQSNVDDYESLMYFDRMLRGSGLFERLEDMGIEEGDTVSIYDLEFEYTR